MSNQTPLQANVRRLMQEKGITYDAVYRKTGLAPSSLARILTGTTQPRYSTIEKLAAVFGTTTAELVNETDDVPVANTDEELNKAKTAVELEHASLFFDAVKDECGKEKVLDKKEPLKQDVSSLVPKYKLSNVFDCLTNGGEPDSYVAAPPGTSRHALENMLCLLATNSAMRPSIFEGDLLYFEKVPEDVMRSGDIVLANTRIGPVVGRLFKRNVTHLIKFDDDNSPEVERVEATSIYGVIKWLVRRL